MFKKARFKLTAWYLLILMCISISFSLVIYSMLNIEIDRFARTYQFRIERRLSSDNISVLPGLRNRSSTYVISDIDLVKDVKARVVLMLIEINAGIFLFAGALSFFLAGRTLKPIADMVDNQHQFISDASHEFRTPLTALKTSMEVSLRDKKLKLSQAKSTITQSIIQVDSLQALSDNLLMLATYQKNGNSRDFTKISLDKIINETIVKMLPFVKDKEVAVIKKIDECMINGDRDSIANVCTILIDNAIKYSKQKGKIEITLTHKGRKAIFTVKDYGIGIAEKDLPYIFNRFYRADTARLKTKSSGYGLGLAIAKKIIKSHNGTISIISQVNKQTLFTITFPIS